MDFQPAFFKPRQIFTNEESGVLHSLANEFPCTCFLRNKRNVEEFSCHYAYVSAKIEGCKYSKLGSAILLKHGFTEKEKKFHDALMLVNIHRAFLEVLHSRSLHISEILTSDFLCALHAKASNLLLRDSERGQVRHCAVRITRSEYLPSSDPQILESNLRRLLSAALQVQDPFDLAVFLHCNLAYLQFFLDCNKRVARLVQSAALVANNLTPLFLSEARIPAYLDAIVAYYETGNYELYKHLFFEQYTETMTWFLGRSPR